MKFDTVWLNARLATLSGVDLGLVEHGAVAAVQGRIAFAGRAQDLPSGWDAVERIDCAGRWITPGLVDCHTHLVFGGDRAHEFELRLKGAGYAEIARAGGGIVSTVQATRAASEDDLVASALPRLDLMWRARSIDPTSPKFSFCGDVTIGRLISRPVRELNIMTRRGRFQHRTRFVESGVALLSQETVTALLAVTLGSETRSLQRLDILALRKLRISSSSPGPDERSSSR